MSDRHWEMHIRAELARMVAEGRWRAPRSFDARGPVGTLEGAPGRVVSFASNDYLGLSAHPTVIRAARDALDRWGAGSGASRLVTGSRPVHRELEEALAAWKGTEAAVCFSTGFSANLGVLSTLGGNTVRVLSDELNHASIIDGCRLSRASLAVYRHKDLDHLEALLGDEAFSGVPTLVVTDTVFSMDGDAACLEQLLPLCVRYDGLVVLDEAHAVLGPNLPVGFPTTSAAVVRVGTLSKTLGSLGGFVAASRDVIDLIVNTARPYIFSTAPTPADAAASLAALRLVRSLEGQERRNRLDSLIGQLVNAGLAPSGHPSPIVPVVLGSEEGALAASAKLLEMGLWVPAIRPPTVPRGTSRLRVTLSALHTDEDVERLIVALVDLREKADTSVAAAGSGPSAPSARSAPSDSPASSTLS